MKRFVVLSSFVVYGVSMFCRQRMLGFMGGILCLLKTFLPDNQMVSKSML